MIPSKQRAETAARAYAYCCEGIDPDPQLVAIIERALAEQAAEQVPPRSYQVCPHCDTELELP